MQSVILPSAADAGPALLEATIGDKPAAAAPITTSRRVAIMIILPKAQSAERPPHEGHYTTLPRKRRWIERLLMACAVKRRRFPVGASPTRQPLQPEATGAVMEVTKWLKPSDSVSRYTVTARVCRP